jgi:hypothetical protein
MKHWKKAFGTWARACATAVVTVIAATGLPEHPEDWGNIGKGAAAALGLMEQPTRFLSSVQVGITSIGMLNGIVGEAAFAAGLGIWLQSWGLPPGAAGITATALVVTVITFVTIVFGELVPKRIGQLYPEPVARLTSRPMVAVAALAGPFVRLLSFSTQVVLKLLRVDVDAKRAVTEEEIEATLRAIAGNQGAPADPHLAGMRVEYRELPAFVRRQIDEGLKARKGSFSAAPGVEPELLAYALSEGNDHALVVLNLSDASRTLVGVRPHPHPLPTVPRRAGRAAWRPPQSAEKVCVLVL